MRYVVGLAYLTRNFSRALITGVAGTNVVGTVTKAGKKRTFVWSATTGRLVDNKRRSPLDLEDPVSKPVADGIKGYVAVYKSDRPEQFLSPPFPTVERLERFVFEQQGKLRREGRPELVVTRTAWVEEMTR